MRSGICKLCHQTRDLQLSHLVGRAMYKLCRGTGPGNQDPYVLDVDGYRQTSFQVKDYVLCRECEQRFSRNGEAYVTPLVTQSDDKFPLLKILNAISPTVKTSSSALYSAAVTPTIDRMKLAYFAISVFWRASVHKWRDVDGTLISIDLGRKYNEEIRQYLLGHAPVPRNARLGVVVCKDETSQHMFYMPTKHNQKSNTSPVGLTVRGMTFLFRITNTPRRVTNKFSMINSKDEVIILENRCKGTVWNSSGFDVGAKTR